MKSGGDGIKKVGGNGPAQPSQPQPPDGSSKPERHAASDPSGHGDEYIKPAGNALPRPPKGEAPAAVAAHHPNLPDDLRTALSSPENRELIVSALRAGRESGAIIYIVGLATPGTTLPGRLIIEGGERFAVAVAKVVKTLHGADYVGKKAIPDGFYVFEPGELMSYVLSPEMRRAILDGAKQDTDEAAELSWKSLGDNEILYQIMDRLRSGARESRAKYYVAAGVIHRDLPLILGEGRTARKAQDDAAIALRQLGFSDAEVDTLFRYYFHAFSSDDLDSDLEFLPESESSIHAGGEALTILPGSDRYFPDGAPNSAVLAVAQTIQGVPCDAKSTVAFHRNGQLMFAVLEKGYTKNGIVCAPGEGVVFHPNGELMFAVLGGGTPQTINGVTFRPGTSVGFDKDGGLQAAYRVRVSTTAGIDYEDGAGEPGSADVLFDEKGKAIKPGPGGGKTPASANEGSAPPAPQAGGNPSAGPTTSSLSPASFIGLVFVTTTATEAAADTSYEIGADGTWDPMSSMSGRGSSTFDAASVGTELFFQPGMMMPAPAGAASAGR